RPMEMQHVRYFLALSRTLNFTRAAEAANVSQPALTRAIQQLEHALGGPLFHRERQRTHLSEPGRIMLPYVEAIQTQSEAAKGHRLAQNNVVFSRDLHDEAYVNRANCEMYDFAKNEFRARGVILRKVFSSERDDWVQGMIKAGMGFGFFPELCVTDPGLVTRR